MDRRTCGRNLFLSDTQGDGDAPVSPAFSYPCGIFLGGILSDRCVSVFDLRPLGKEIKKKIIRLSIRELLSMETENEKALVQKKKGKRVLFAMSVFALLLGCFTFAVLLIGEVSDNAGER